MSEEHLLTPRAAALTSALSLPERVESPDEAVVILIGHPEDRLLGTRWTLSHGGALEVGRSPDAQVSLPEVPSVSRRHALIRFGEEGITIEDLGSTNGTRVDGQAIAGRVTLHSGARFQAGPVHFKLLHERDVEQAYHATLHDMAMRDVLTQAFNRRKLTEEAERECARARRHRSTLSLILFDIDFFKRVNDTHGHPEGDAVLVRTTAVVREVVREEQVLARVGGEEFAVLCPEVGLESAAVFAERLRVCAAGVVHGDGAQTFSITCSFGVAEWHTDRPSFAELYAAADAALYAAKQGGRNRVELAP